MSLHAHDVTVYWKPGDEDPASRAWVFVGPSGQGWEVPVGESWEMYHPYEGPALTQPIHRDLADLVIWTLRVPGWKTVDPELVKRAGILLGQGVQRLAQEKLLVELSVLDSGNRLREDAPRRRSPLPGEKW